MLVKVKHCSFFLFLLLTILSCTPSAGEKEERWLKINTEILAKVPYKEPLPIPIYIEKAFSYDQYTLADVYPYKDTVRFFQWNKIEDHLRIIQKMQEKPSKWGVVQNRKGVNGVPPLADNLIRNEYNNLEDLYGVEKYQAGPLYSLDSREKPKRYIEDGSLVKILEAPDSMGMVKVEAAHIGGEWFIPAQYIKFIADSVTMFHKVIVIDRTNQNIAVLELVGSTWLVRSMNPATTGLRRPPYQYETPLGIFVVQQKKNKMYFLIDGTSQIAGFAPYASRFSNGAYVHGIPINYPRTTIIEYSNSLGTTPRSHKCVRNATSHAKYIYDWAPVHQSLVVVIE